MLFRSFLATLLIVSAAHTHIELRSGVTAVWVRPGWEVVAPATFLNAGAEPLRLLVEMDTSGMPPGSYPYFCWGPSCYAPGVLLSPDTVTLAPGTEERSFKAYVYADQSTPATSAALRFLLREAYTGAVLLQHTLTVHIGTPSAESLQLVWAQTGIAATGGATGESVAAVYNGGTQTRSLVVRLEPSDIPPEAVELCLGDTCYGTGTLVAADTLRIPPRQLFSRLRCRVRSGESVGTVRVLLTDADAGTPVAQYTVTVSQVTGIAVEAGNSTCLRQMLVREYLPLSAEPGTVLELYTLLGQLRLRLPGDAFGFRLPELEPGLYSYRLLRGRTPLCSGLLLVD
ncbi:hypothetical protein HRbin21_00556 [bacterium HR21]|nr:hypothetical protein HRbin21_00556 [bacterium HR21]